MKCSVPGGVAAGGKKMVSCPRWRAVFCCCFLRLRGGAGSCCFFFFNGGMAVVTGVRHGSSSSPCRGAGCCLFSSGVFVFSSLCFSFKRALSRPKKKIPPAAGVESSIYRLEGSGLLLRVGRRAAPRLVGQWARLERCDSPGFSSSKGVGLRVLAEHAGCQN